MKLKMKNTFYQLPIILLYIFIILSSAAFTGCRDHMIILFIEPKELTCSVSGQVQDTYNVAIPGASINITNSTGDVNENTITDGSGNFSFPSLPCCANCYSITVTMVGYNPGNLSNVEANSNANTNVGIIYLTPTSGVTFGRISLTTLDAIDLTKIDGANVEIARWDSTFADAQVTDLNGYFQSNVLDPGAYTVTITKAAYQNEIITGVAVNGDVDLGNIYMDRLSVVTGSLFGKVVDLDWNGVPGATVVFDNTAGTISQSVLTDESGNFDFAAVPEGSNFILQVSKAGYLPVTKNNITVNGGVANDAGTIFLVPDTALSGRFNGRVIDSYDGQPINKATVKFLDYNSAVVGTQITAADGTFTSAVLDPGSYTIIVTKTLFFDLVFDNSILNGNKNLNDLPLCEILTGSQMRLYVVWASLPNDLDLHVVGPTSNASWDPADNRFHVSFDTDGYYEDTGEYTSSLTNYTTSLVLDDTNGSGPETINFLGNYDLGDYKFTMHLADAYFGNLEAKWYDGSYLPIARVYNSTGLVREIPFPSTASSSDVYFWKICRINKFGTGDNDITVTVPTGNPYLYIGVDQYNEKTLMDWSF